MGSKATPDSDTDQTLSGDERANEFLTGLVIRAYGKHFVARTKSGDFRCLLRVNIKRKSKTDTPVVVGDDVHLTRLSDTEGVIERVEPRKTAFFRPQKGRSSLRQTLAANIDQLVVVSSCWEPPLKPRFIDRFIVAGDLGGLESVVILNKVDLGKPDIVEKLREGYESIGIPTIITSAETGEGLEKLRSVLVGKKSLFAGHSGVGKSTLLNYLLPGINIKTAEVSENSSRGKHTTTRVELHELPTGGFVLDSPGLKVLSLWKVSQKTLAQHFLEFEQYMANCRFRDCVHVSEPDCAVRDAAESGKIPLFRYQSYIHIRETIES